MALIIGYGFLTLMRLKTLLMFSSMIETQRKTPVQSYQGGPSSSDCAVDKFAAEGRRVEVFLPPIPDTIVLPVITHQPVVEQQPPVVTTHAPVLQ